MQSLKMGEISPPSDTRDIARGAFTNFLGILARSLNFTFYIFIARIYGAKTTGLFVLALATVDVVSKLAILGLDRGILTVCARKKQANDEAGFYRSVAQALIIGTAASVLMVTALYFLADLITHRFYQQADLLSPLKSMSFGIFFWMISAIFLFATRSVRIMKYEVYTKSLLEPLVLLTGAVLCYHVAPGINGLTAAFLGSVAFGAVAAIFFFGKTFSFALLFRYGFTTKGLRDIITFAAPIGCYDMLNLLLQRIDMFMLGKFVTSHQLGVYGIAQMLAFGAKKIRQSFDPIVIPVLSGSSEAKNRVTLRLHYQNVTRWILILNLAALGLIFFVAEPAMAVFGKAFQHGNITLVLLAGSIVINGALGVSELFILIDRPLINLFNTLATIIISIILNLLLIPRWGMEGAAMATLVAYAVMNAARIIEVNLLYRLHPFTLFHAKSVGAAAVSFSLITLLSMGHSIFKALWIQPVLGVLYLVLYFLLLSVVGLAEEESVVLKRVKIKFRNALHPIRMKIG